MVKRGQAASVPLAKYAGPADILESEQSRARAMFSMADMPGAGRFPILAAPFQSASQAIPQMRCPTIPGADNLRVWCEWLGHSESELKRWVNEHVV